MSRVADAHPCSTIWPHPQFSRGGAADPRQAGGRTAPTLELEPQPARATRRPSETGLDDLGRPGFRERLDVCATRCNTEAGPRPPPGMTMRVSRSSYGMLKNRLLLEDPISRHPEIEEVADRAADHHLRAARAPARRTCTTCSSADPALRHLPYWESLEPVLPAASAGRGEPDPRRDARREALGRGRTPRCRTSGAMHEMTVDHAHEEIQLLAHRPSRRCSSRRIAPMPTLARLTTSAPTRPRRTRT